MDRRPLVKICGVVSWRDAVLCADEGADLVGFIFAEQSPRLADVGVVRRIVRGLPKSLLPVGVFMDQPLSEARSILEAVGLRVAQLHGRESPAYASALGCRVIKVFHNRNAARLGRFDAFAYMLDLPKTADPQSQVDPRVALRAKRFGRLFLSGKLDPSNVGGLVRLVRPYGVDACTATERYPRKKDRKKVRTFIEAARG